MADEEKRKLGTMRRRSLIRKINAPKGIILSKEETHDVITLWEEDREQIDKNNKELSTASASIERTLKFKLPEALEDAKRARSEALRFYKVTKKDPIKKREWARRLIIADAAQKTISSSQKRMKAMAERLTTVMQDATLEKSALDIRIAEAQAYEQMGDGIRLVGETLIDARTRANKTSVNFDNLETGLEGIEKQLKNAKSDEDIIAQADKLLGKSEQ